MRTQNYSRSIGASRRATLTYQREYAGLVEQRLETVFDEGGRGAVLVTHFTHCATKPTSAHLGPAAAHTRRHTRWHTPRTSSVDRITVKARNGTERTAGRIGAARRDAARHGAARSGAKRRGRRYARGNGPDDVTVRRLERGRRILTPEGYMYTRGGFSSGIFPRRRRRHTRP